ncbi:MAG: hypothetical protein JOZ29_18945 [Deltaproteobacteria bacterium]|nr:hypothetical protein [Deltaproteobacteria bacterium]
MIGSIIDLSALHHHRDINFESGRFIRFRTLNSTLDAFDGGHILLVRQQGHLRATISLQLGIVEYGAAKPALDEAAGNFALNLVEACP